MCKRNGNTLRHSLPGLFCLAVLLVACGQPATPALTPITMQLAWTHQAQFAGMYVADQKGCHPGRVGDQRLCLPVQAA